MHAPRYLCSLARRERPKQRLHSPPLTRAFLSFRSLCLSSFLSSSSLCVSFLVACELVPCRCCCVFACAFSSQLPRCDEHCGRPRPNCDQIGPESTQTWLSSADLSRSRPIGANFGADSTEFGKICAAARQVADYPDQMRGDYVQFERECGTYESWREAQRKVQALREASPAARDSERVSHGCYAQLCALPWSITVFVGRPSHPLVSDGAQGNPSRSIQKASRVLAALRFFGCSVGPRHFGHACSARLPVAGLRRCVARHRSGVVGTA